MTDEQVETYGATFIFACVLFISILLAYYSNSSEKEFCNSVGDKFVQEYNTTHYNVNMTKATIHCANNNYNVTLVEVCEETNYFNECLKSRFKWRQEET